MKSPEAPTWSHIAMCERPDLCACFIRPMGSQQPKGLFSKEIPEGNRLLLKRSPEKQIKFISKEKKFYWLQFWSLCKQSEGFKLANHHIDLETNYSYVFIEIKTQIPFFKVLWAVLFLRRLQFSTNKNEPKMSVYYKISRKSRERKPLGWFINHVDSW